LEQFGFTGVQGNVFAKHEIIGFYDLPSVKIAIVSTAPSQNFDCHACAPKLSFFVFEQKNGKWEISQSLINQLSLGSWGEAPSKTDFKAIKLGNGTYGLDVQSAGGGQGYFETYTMIYLIGPYTMKKILDVQTGLDDGGTINPGQNSWKATLTYEDKNAPLYDIVLEVEGVKDGKSFYETKRYRFDGTEYVTAP
jgi:hypothetical protein